MQPTAETACFTILYPVVFLAESGGPRAQTALPFVPVSGLWLPDPSDEGGYRQVGDVTWNGKEFLVRFRH